MTQRRASRLSTLLLGAVAWCERVLSNLHGSMFDSGMGNCMIEKRLQQLMFDYFRSMDVTVEWERTCGETTDAAHKRMDLVVTDGNAVLIIELKYVRELTSLLEWRVNAFRELRSPSPKSLTL
jgi:hypothetical protein